MPMIQKPGNWLTKALGILTGEVPQQLDTQISPVLDVMQQGAGVAVQAVNRCEGVGAVGAQSLVCIAGDLNVTRLVRCLLTRSGAAATIDAGIFFQPPPEIWTASSFHMYRNTTILAATTRVPWSEISRGADWWTLPPGWAVYLRHEGVAAGDTIVLTTMSLAAPAGFKLW